VDGLLNLHEFTEQTGIDLPEGPYETAAGFVLARLGEVPAVGQSVEVAEHRITVTEMDGRRIARSGSSRRAATLNRRTARPARTGQPAAAPASPAPASPAPASPAPASPRRQPGARQPGARQPGALGGQCTGRLRIGRTGPGRPFARASSPHAAGRARSAGHVHAAGRARSAGHVHAAGRARSAGHVHAAERPGLRGSAAERTRRRRASRAERAVPQLSR